MELEGKASNLSVTHEEEKKASCKVKYYLETLLSSVVVPASEFK